MLYSLHLTASVKGMKGILWVNIKSKMVFVLHITQQGCFLTDKYNSEIFSIIYLNSTNNYKCGLYLGCRIFNTKRGIVFKKKSILWGNFPDIPRAVYGICPGHIVAISDG